MPAKTTRRKPAKSKPAASKSKSTAKPRSNAARSKQKLEEEDKRKKQVWTIIVFAVGLLLTALTLVQGQNVWSFLHNFLFGFFSLPAFFIGPVILVMTVLYAKEKLPGSLRSKVLQLCAIFVFWCAEMQILSSQVIEGAHLWDKICAVYDNGIHLHGGGLAGGLLGAPLQAALGKNGAAILVAIVLFCFALIFTGSTLLGFLRGVSKPVKKLNAGIDQHRGKRKGKIDIDLGPDGMPQHPVASPKKFHVPDLPEEPEPDPEPPFVPDIPDTPADLDDLVKKAVGREGQQLSLVEPKEPPKGSDNSIAEELNRSTRLVEEEKPEYCHPPMSLLKQPVNAANTDVSGELRANADRLVDTLKSFGVETRIIDICRGPSVTRYELQPSAGVKISKITNLADDIALNLAAGGVRIEAPIPNKPAVGIEVPNKKTDIVTLREIVDSPEFERAKSKLTFAVGRDIAGNVTLADIAKMPHMLIAGSTGSGKSVCINSMIISLIYKSSPDDVRLLMIDPKVVELGVYNGIPHLLVPVVTDPRKAAGALGWAVTEMLNRYKLFADSGVRDLVGYNKMARRSEDTAPLPQIVIIIDELADLMMAASNEVEDSICRLAQMARAAGMHLVIATQRPSVDVITGVIKANIPSRIAFAVSSQVDSRTILDSGGAEKLLGKGDMLFNPIGVQKPVRVQGCFVTDKEVEQVVGFIKSSGQADYSDDILEEIEKQAAAEKPKAGDGGGFDDQDSLLPEAIEVVVEAGQASTSFLQRRLKLGYARAARIMDDMEQRGVVGPQEGSKPRQVLITKQQWIERNLNQNND